MTTTAPSRAKSAAAAKPAAAKPAAAKAPVARKTPVAKPKAVTPEPVVETIVEPVVEAKPASEQQQAKPASEQQQAKPAPKQEHGLGHYIGIALSLALLLLVIVAGAVLIVIPKMMGAIPLTVLTQSMEPLLPPGTLIVDQPIKASQVHLGDIVTYQIASGKPDVITHRVVAISDSTTGKKTFTFKGDNNAYPDAKPVIPAQIKGRVVYSVPWIGYVSYWMNGPARAVVVPIAAGVLFLFAAWMFISGGVEAARKRRRAESAGNLPNSLP